jgi:chromosome segregation ATPase
MAELSDEVKQLVADLKAIEAKNAQLDREIESLADKIEKLPDPVLSLTGVSKQYLGAIAKSDGLTQGRPATLSAIKAAEQKPSVQTIRAAIGAMEKHLDELGSAHKGSPKLAKFEKALNEVIKSTEALLG